MSLSTNLQDGLDKSNDAFLEWLRQTVNLSSGVLAITVTFATAFLDRDPSKTGAKPGILEFLLLTGSWILFALAILVGQATLGNMTVQLRQDPGRALVDAPRLMRRAKFTWVCYLLGVVLIAAFGFIRLLNVVVRP